jgi:hypothetical protein
MMSFSGAFHWPCFRRENAEKCGAGRLGQGREDFYRQTPAAHREQADFETRCVRQDALPFGRVGLFPVIGGRGRDVAQPRRAQGVGRRFGPHRVLGPIPVPAQKRGLHGGTRIIRIERIGFDENLFSLPVGFDPDECPRQGIQQIHVAFKQLQPLRANLQGVDELPRLALQIREKNERLDTIRLEPRYLRQGKGCILAVAGSGMQFAQAQPGGPMAGLLRKRLLQRQDFFGAAGLFARTAIDDR